jgi:hypothetical protein
MLSRKVLFRLTLFFKFQSYDLLFFVIPFLFFQAAAQNYFQQETNYDIHVTLNDREHELNAFEQIEYINHSPLTLNEIYFHLWPNAYRDENTALAKEFVKQGNFLFRNTSEQERGFIDSLDFKIDGKKIQWSLLPDTADVCLLKLDRPLLPGEKIIITTPFHVKIPSAKISRLGHNGQAYYITQWFPKPAVYDRNGWNYFPYINQGEFYSEYGTFDVSITLPDNYVVGATGSQPQGDPEISWLNSKVNETVAMKDFPGDLNFPPSSTTTKTLHYHEGKIHDFAWFADKRWHVLKDEIELPGSKDKITVWLMFTNAEANYWKDSKDYVRHSMNYFSKWIGHYPYRSITLVDVNDAEGNGMEYPGITAIGNYGDRFELEVTMAHEIGHNWFYGMLGSNERKHPWMDEGMTNFLETRYVYTKYSADQQKQMEMFSSGGLFKLFGLERLNHRKIQYLTYLSGARKNIDQSPETPADRVPPENYHADVYYKTCLGFDLLKSYLGDSLFDLCLHHYFDTWKFKHPQPEDLKKVFTEGSGKNLDWMFDEWIGTNKKLDYKISNIKAATDGNEFLVTIKNAGQVAAPFSISSLKNNMLIHEQWINGFREKITLKLHCDSCDEFRIDAEEKIPELCQTNNTIRTRGILKKTEPIRFQFLGKLEDPTVTQLFYSPVLGWNNYNKVMAGGAVYNIFIPEKKMEFVAMPMYAFGTSDLTGGGNIAYHFYPKHSAVHKIQVSVGAQSYSYQHDEFLNEDGSASRSILKFAKIDSRINIFLLPKDRTEKIKYQVELRNIFIHKDVPFFYQNMPSTKEISMFELNAGRTRFNAINPSDLNLKIRANENLFLASIEEKLKITYASAEKCFDIRLFAGNIFYRNTNVQGEDYRFQLSGYTGSADYLFDEVFLGRTETTGVLAQQFVAAEGGFAVPTLFYRSASQWMASVNLKTSLPGILPVKLFADLATFDHASELTNGSSLSFELGAEVNVIKNIFTIYFPLTYSEDIKYIVDQENLNYGNLVRFELHLNKLNPLSLFRELEF